MSKSSPVWRPSGGVGRGGGGVLATEKKKSFKHISGGPCPPMSLTLKKGVGDFSPFELGRKKGEEPYFAD